MSEFLDKHNDKIFVKYDKDKLLRDVESYKSGKGNLYKILRHFFEQEMYKCKGRRGEKTPMEALEDDDTMNYILEYIKSKPKFYASNDVANVKSFFRNAQRVASKVSNFPVREALGIYEKYSKIGDTIYDSSCGFGSRMCACILSGRNYIGSDPNLSLVEKLNECGSWLKNNIKGVGDYRIIPHGSEIEEPNIQVDLTFTSPPYYKLEKYGLDKTQSIIKYDTYDKWINGYARLTIDNCIKYTNVGGIIAINIKNSNDNKKYPLFNDWFNLLDNNKTEYVETIEMKQSAKRQYGNKHFTGVKGSMGLKEPIMVFQKKFLV